MTGAQIHVPAATVHRQIAVILEAWGMPADMAETTAAVMTDTDLAGIDSHGLSMLMMYEKLMQAGTLLLSARPVVERRTPVAAAIDAQGGIGHPASVMAMDLAISMAKAAGLGAVTVRNSHHFGAAGYYASRAAEQGLLGLVTSTARTVAVVPTRSAVPVLGTNPIAFAAPAVRSRPFLLDMATSTVAANKVKVYELTGHDLPPGWVLDGDGQPVTDPALAMDALFSRTPSQGPRGGLTPIGGTAEMRSHKGYGLGLLAQILAGTLSGGAFHYLGTPAAGDNIGHFSSRSTPLPSRHPASSRPGSTA
jgi:LDH2 family malate/lactate/ureidoglycolate dehydrogenase